MRVGVRSGEGMERDREERWDMRVVGDRGERERERVVVGFFFFQAEDGIRDKAT